jgi:hypothetical protein
LKPGLALVRDTLPMERISRARIRQWIDGDATLGDWSRAAPAAIRPQQLATLIRNRIWEAHDVTLGAVRERLERQASKGSDSVDYWVRLEVEFEPDKEIEVISRTRFTVAPSGRLRAEIELTSGDGAQPITEGPVPLRRRRTD